MPSVFSFMRSRTWEVAGLCDALVPQYFLLIAVMPRLPRRGLRMLADAVDAKTLAAVFPAVKVQDAKGCRSSNFFDALIRLPLYAL